MKVMLVVILLAVFCTVEYSNSAAVRSEEFAEQLRRIVHEMEPESLRMQRATESDNDDEPKRNCYDTPCGWISYNAVTRRHTNFMLNTCKCPDETYKCVRTGENVSMSAYVYHCRQNSTAEELEPENFDDPDYVS